MSFSTLPPEICGSICHELKELGGNLAPLCTTSRNFSREAERILYHSVDLRGRELPAIESLEILDKAKIVEALRKCINLKELRGAHGWMLSGFLFRLQKFEGPVPWEGGVGDDFWKTQTEICVLSLPYLPNLPSFENQLPNVIALGTPTLDVLPTLTTLSVQGAWAYGPSSIPDTPDVYCGLRTRLATSEHYRAPEIARALRLYPPNLGSFNSHSGSYEMASAPDLEHLRVDILKACPTLLRAAIGSGVVRGQEMRIVSDVVYSYNTLHSYRVQDQMLRFDLRTGWSRHCLISAGLVRTLESQPLRLLTANSLAGGRIVIKCVAQSGQTTAQSPIKKETPFIRQWTVEKQKPIPVIYLFNSVPDIDVR
ncbi:hypothetical protein B0H14DRAFT_2582321 [Mycena olivaceomarginata]|nr:hypothetical protein B0H14DRAFT_2582321 [Mycena olivaceomarginata]